MACEVAVAAAAETAVRGSHMTHAPPHPRALLDISSHHISIIIMAKFWGGDTAMPVPNPGAGLAQMVSSTKVEHHGIALIWG